MIWVLEQCTLSPSYAEFEVTITNQKY